MMFETKNFIKEALIGAVGNKPDYQIKLLASDWLRLGMFVESDLAEIDAAIKAQYPQEETEVLEMEAENENIS